MLKADFIFTFKK